ncbi:hypothetical protein [Acetobacterium carbinolicum]|uniref:hypothetical protein n=1 Tax=Acetobacterium carbinolicum TaxID=52690 RepID=UPI0039C92112
MDEKFQIKLTRKQLYDEIWEMSVMGVSKKYDVNYSKLIILVKEVDIPYPPSSYWTKLAYEKEVEKVELTGSENEIVILPDKAVKRRSKKKVVDQEVDKKEPNEKPDFENLSETNAVQAVDIKDIEISIDDQLLRFLADDERSKVQLAAQQIKILDLNTPIHKKIKAYKKTIKEWNEKDTKPEFAQRALSNYWDKPPFLAGVISEATLPRVFLILGTLYSKIEELGGSVNDDLSVQIRNERFTFEISEMQDKLEHILTKQEAKELIKYKDEKKRYSWSSEPKFRKYDYVFNGKLRISVFKGKYFKDSDKNTIENQLGDFLIKLYEKSETVRIEREAREESERQRREEERKEEERRNQYNNEVELTIRLKNEALDFEKACRIRSYIAAIESASQQGEFEKDVSDWIDWANKKADWFDPVVARNDEFFGVREHKKSEDEKSLKRKGYYW